MKKGIDRVRFANGFELVYQRSTAAPVVALDLWVKAGGADETSAQAGLAHVVEHMLFKGTARRPPGSMAREVENLGGEINAFTSFDYTVYTMAVASRYAAEGMDLLHDAASGSLFDPDELKREQLVILEEIKRSRDLPHQFLSRLLFSSAYRVHPYKNPVIGDAKSVAGFTRDDCLAFVGKWYRASNMALVCVGDRPFEEIRRLAETTFGKLKAAPLPKKQRRPAEPPRTKLKTAMSGRNTTEVYFDLAFGAPDAGHEDIAALDLLSTIMGHGDSSRLYERIKLKENLVRSISAGVYVPADPGLFYIGAVASSEDFPEALRAVADEIRTIREKPVREAELAKAREMVEADFIFHRETAQSRAQKLGYCHIVLNDPDHEDRYLAKLENLRTGDITGAARRYLDPSGAVLALIHPKGEKPPVTVGEASKILKSANGRRTVPVPAAGRKEGPVRMILPNGARLLVDTNRAAPIVSMRAAFPGGSRLDPARTPGLFHFLGETLPRGTANRTVYEIADETDRIGGHLEGFSGRNSFGIVSSFLSKHLERALDLACDVLANPVFDPGEVEKAREDTLAAIARREDNPAGAAFRVFEKKLYGSHPYGNDVLGTEASVQSITPDRLSRLYQTAADPAGFAIALSGDVDPSEVYGILKERLSFPHKPGKPMREPEKPGLPGKAGITRRDSRFEQTHIVLGFLGTTVKTQDRLALRIANAMLAGQGGRLFTRLRDELALAYSVSSVNIEGLDRGYIAGYIATSPERADEAFRGLFDIMTGLAHDFSDEEAEKAKKKLAGGYEISLQENEFRASQMALDEVYGLDWRDYRKVADKILAVKPSAVRKAAAGYLDPGNWAAVIAGPGK